MFRVSSVNLWAKRLPRQVFHNATGSRISHACAVSRDAILTEWGQGVYHVEIGSGVRRPLGTGRARWQGEVIRRVFCVCFVFCVQKTCYSCRILNALSRETFYDGCWLGTVLMSSQGGRVSLLFFSWGCGTSLDTLGHGSNFDSPPRVRK